MIVRALDSTGDWTFGAGKNNYLSGTNAVAQAIATRLLMFLGDCFFATNQGIDWWTFLGGSKNQLALQLAINAVILNTENVTGIVTVNVNLDSVTRAFSVTYIATSAFGNVTGNVNQNLGVSPVSPPTSSLLLPQTNFGLLNTTSAIIPGAKFDPDIYWEVDLEYFIERRNSSSSFVQRGTLVCAYDTDTALWSIQDLVLGGSSGPVSGVTFSIDSSTGQVSYSSDNMTSTGYVGNLIIQSLQTFVAGV